MHDGSIIFSTALDNAQLEKDLAGLTKKIEAKEKNVAKITQSLDKAKESAAKMVEKVSDIRTERVPFSEQLNDVTVKAGEALLKIKGLKDQLAEAQTALDPKDSQGFDLPFEKFLRYQETVSNLPKEIAKQEKEYENLNKEVDRLAKKVNEYDAKIDQATANLNEKNNSAKNLTAQLEQQASELALQKAEAGELVQQIDEAARKQNGFTKTSAAAEKSMHRLGGRIMELVKSAFIFNVISAGLRAVQQITMKYIKTNGEARQAIAQLKGALLTLAQPLIEVLIPAFTLLVNILTRIITAVAQFVSMLFGKTLKQSKDGAKALYEEANGIEAVGGAAKEAMGSLAGFDEINTINTEDAGGGGAAGETVAPDFSWADDMGGIGDRLKEIADLVGLIAAGLALWKISELLPGVLGTIAQKLAGLLLTVGGLLLYWNGLTDAWENGVDWLNLIEMIGGLAAAALGLYLLFGPIAAGIALVVGGIGMLATGFHDAMENGWSLQNVLLSIAGILAAGLGIAMITGSWIPLLIAAVAGIAVAIIANWDTIQQFLEGSVGFAVGLLSGAVLMLGAILLFSGANIGLGLGLLALGAVGLAASLAANWDTVQQALEGPVGTVTALVSSALLVLGAVLLFSGAAVPLGIGLMAAGAVGLVTAIAANWNTVQTALRSPVSAITALISGALLVLGVILLFTGAAIPLGLGLIGAGAIGLASTIAPNWDFVLDAIMGAWRDVKNWWKANAEKFFTLDYWKNLGKDIIDGFLDGLKKAWDGLASWFSGVWDSLFGNRKVSVDVGAKSSAGNYNSSPRMAARLIPDVFASGIPSISEVQIPRLARGAVIPPNREFMAVLGDQRSGNNLEAPEDLIRKIVREESGGGSAELLPLLQAILSAVKDGHVILVDGAVFGRTAVRAINNANIAAGKQLLLI